MRTTPFRTVLHNVARLAFGTADNLETAQANTLTEFINQELRTALEEYPWPEWCLLEQRWFRDTWTAATYAQGSEVYHAGTDAYWVTDTGANAGQVPGVAAQWTEITDLDKYVAWDQTGLTPLGEVLAVYTANPRTTSSALELNFSITAAGVQPVGAGTSVWVEFRRRVPRFVADVYSAATAYVEGDLVYYPTTGECYEALTNTTNNVPTATQYWTRVDFPYVVAPYVEQAAYAKWLASDGQLEKTRLVRNEAELLLTRAMQQNAVTSRQTARFAVA